MSSSSALETDILNFVSKVIGYIDELRAQYGIVEPEEISVDYIVNTDHRHIIGLKIFPRTALFNIIDMYFIQFNANLNTLYQSNNYQFINSFTNVYKNNIEIMYTIRSKIS